MSCRQSNIDVNTFMYQTPHSEGRIRKVIAIDLGKVRLWGTFFSIPPSQLQGP